MYNYDFLGKNIVSELVNVLVSINDNCFTLNTLVTNENILLFKNIKANTVISGRGIYEMPEYDLVLDIKLKGLNFKIEDNNTIINYNKKELIIYNFDLNTALNI